MSGSVPQRYVQIFGNYDKSFVNKCRTVRYYTQDNTGNDVNYAIPCVFASPDRAFAQMASQIARQKGVKKETIDVNSIPLPIMSISRPSESVDLKRYVRHKFNRLMYNPAEDKYIGMVRPNPTDITYQIDVWARTISDLDDITNQINLWLRADEFYLTVEHPVPMNERLVLTQITDIHDHSQMSPNTEEKRTLRKTFTFVVHGWVVPEKYEVGIVRKVIVDIYDNINELSPVFLDRITVTSTSDGVVPPTPAILPLPEDDTMGHISSVLYGLLIVGEANAGEDYGAFPVPAPATITGMSVAVLGHVPTGADLELQVRLNGNVDTTRYIVLPAGARSHQVIFGSSFNVVAGDVLSVHCVGAGSGDAGDWVEVRYAATINVSI